MQSVQLVLRWARGVALHADSMRSKSRRFKPSPDPELQKSRVASCEASFSHTIVCLIWTKNLLT